MAKRRRFTPEFKAEVVIEALSGQSSQAELCRKHNLSDVQLSKRNLNKKLVLTITEFWSKKSMALHFSIKFDKISTISYNF